MRLLLGACVLALVALALLPAMTLAAPEPQPAPLNPAFTDYQKALRLGRLPMRTTEGGHMLGLVPAPVLLPDSPAAASPADILAAPATFDLRTSGKVSPVKNQGSFGTCWTFATLGSLESSYLPGTLYDFSEDNVARTAGFDYDIYVGGGNSYMSTADLAKSGPVYETDDAYGDYTTPAGLTPRAHLQDALIVVNDDATTKDQAADIAAVKDWLTTGNAVYTTMKWSTSAYNSPGKCFYGGAASYSGEGGHAVTIVGWDDAFSAANFTSHPAGDGAWIVKNSWGSSWGNAGYFYLSYYDYWAERFAVAFIGTSVSTFTGVYQYDPLGWVDSYGYGSATPTVAWGANDFTATSSDPITMVGFYTPSANAQYELYTAATHSGTRTAQGSGTLSRAGYHTVALSAPLAVANGQSFSIILRLTTPGYSWPIVVEYASAGYSSNATSAAGQSFMSSSGSSWSDVGSSSNTTPMNVCIKAFSKPPTADTTPPTTTADGVPAGWAPGAVTVTFAADDGSGVGVQATLVRVDSGTYQERSSVLVSGDGTHHVDYYSTDKAGYAETPKSATVRIDTTAPSTTAPSRAPAGWTNVVPTIALLWSDNASGVVSTEFRIQGNGTWNAYAAPFPVTTQGESIWEYRSVDAAGNAESPQVLSVKLDSVAPATAAFAASVKTRKSVALKYQVNDATPGCGKASATIKIFKGKRLKKTLKTVSCTTNVKASYRWRCALAAGRYTLRVFATDIAGNVQSKVGSARLTVK